MILVEHIETWGFEHAIRGMRNPMMSHDKGDSYWVKEWDEGLDKPANIYFKIGNEDMGLMQRLYKASLIGDNHAHRKYLRQIMVSMDITAPRYWWQEFDTYKVGTVANSASTMHKITAHQFSIDDFSHDHLVKRGCPEFDLFGYDDPKPLGVLQAVCDMLNKCRDLYLQEKEPAAKKTLWWQLIQLLPQSYNQLRTVTMNYENVFTIINQRTGHKLDEWNQFVNILWKLPYVKDIRSVEVDNK